MILEENIVWLASYPKSGSTWFRIFLDNLYSTSIGPISINSLKDIPIASSRKLFDAYSGANSSDLTTEEINILKPQVFRLISQENKDIVFIKVHDAWYKNHDGNEVFPKEITKGVLYFIRNPLDVAVSFANHNQSTTTDTLGKMSDRNFELCVTKNKIFEQFNQKILSWSDHVSSWADDSNLHVKVIRYEDLIQNCYTTFSEALGFVGIKIHKSNIESAIKNSAFKELRRQEERFGFKEKSLGAKYFFRSGKINDWENYLTKPQVEKFVKHHKKIMKRFGYLDLIDY